MVCKKEQAVSKEQNMSSYAPNSQVLHELPEVQAICKFGTVYFVVAEKLAFMDFAR